MNGLKAAFLATCNEIEEDTEDFIADLPNESSKFIGKQVFIEEDFEIDSKESKSDTFKALLEVWMKILKSSTLLMKNNHQD